MLPLTAFGKNRAKADGLSDDCRECHRVAAAKRRAEFPELTREQTAKSASRPEAVLAKRKYMSEYQRRPDVKQRHKARNAVKDALLSGRMVRPQCCEACESCPPPRDLHAHHADYSRPLDVRWLCRQCHAKVHSQSAHSTPDGFNATSIV